MSGLWDVIVPAAGTNLILNPSLETGTTGWAQTGGTTVARDTTTAKFGGACLSCVTPGSISGEGWIVTPSGLTPSLTYVLSVWAKAAAGYSGTAMVLILRERTSGGSTVGTTLLSLTLTETWTRYEISRTFGATGTDAQLILRTAGTTALTFYSDALQLEAASVATTYIDGDQGTWCRWTGTAHASTSTRDGKDRSGGVITAFDTLGGNPVGQGATGQGMPPHAHVATPYGLLDGQLFQRTGIGGRTFVVPLWINGSSLADLHTKRRAIADAVKRDLVAPVQPLRLRYRGGAETVEIACHYDGGLEGVAREGFQETVALRFVADDPYWHGLGNASVGMVGLLSLTDADYIVERNSDGAYRALGGGLSNLVYCAVYGPDGNLYVGGQFTTAYNSAGTGAAAAVNYVAKWNGSTWSALNGGFNGAVYTLAFGPDGTLYAGGTFTTGNGGTATSLKYLAKWNGATWSAVGGNVGTLLVQSLAFGANGLMYIGGSFTAWPCTGGDVTNGNGIVSWDGSVFRPLAGGITPTNTVIAIVVAQNGDLYVGGSFASARLTGAVTTVANTAFIAKWTASAATPAWAAVSTTALNDQVAAMVLTPSGSLIVGGTFTNAGYPYVARWNGVSWSALGSGLNGAVYWLQVANDGTIYASGAFTTAGGLATGDHLARWTGSAWTPMEVDLPGVPATVVVATHPDGRLAIGFDTSGTAIAHNISTTSVTNRGSAPSSPVIRMLGPGTIVSITNWTTGQVIYFNYTLAAGEYLILDLRPGKLSCVSSLRGDVFGTAILPSSDLTTFLIAPGANSIYAKMPSGTTAATELTIMWKENYLGTDV